MTAAVLSADRTRSNHAWFSVAAIAGGTFVMVTSEFLPIGLLGGMARDLGVSEGQAGLMVTAPGAVAAVAAPVLTSLAAKLDRRLLLLMLTGLIIVADLVVATGSNLAAILVGRMLLGAALGGFWAFAAAVGRRLMPDNGNRATALILAGISVGTVTGVPMGTLIGALAGWRAAFTSVAALGALVLVAQAVLLPSIPGGASMPMRSVFTVFRVPMARAGYLAAALIAGGHFAAYTYLQPFLARSGWNDGPALTGLLAAFGVAGIGGTWVGERLASRALAISFASVAFLLAGAIGLMIVGAAVPWIVVAGVVLWGVAFGAFPVCAQIWVFQAAPDRFEAGSALMVTVFQFAVAMGALLGGRLVDGIGITAAFSAGGILAFAAGLTMSGYARKTRLGF